MTNIQSLTSSSLSLYRTTHHFENYAEINSIDAFKEYCNFAAEKGIKLYILGNGSNTLFIRKKVKTLILKNNLPRYIKPLPDCRLEVSSSTQLADVLKYCYENSWTSFYYLASVPATIGGALAMNAGRGRQHNFTIYDFVESITFFDSGKIITLKNEEIERGYRETIFTGVQQRLILSAVLKFESENYDVNPLTERRQWAKEHQDNVAPNCGSVFKEANFVILGKLRGLKIGKASFSKKTYNWILNKSEDSLDIKLLILVARILHFITFRKLVLEIITVD